MNTNRLPRLANPEASATRDETNVRVLPTPAPSTRTIVVEMTTSEPFRNPLAPTAPNRILLPLIGARDPVPEAAEPQFAAVVRQAQKGDIAARNALYAAFQPKIAMFVSNYPARRSTESATFLWDRDDVAQEAFLVFCTLVECWEGDIPFGQYVITRFAWRLRDAVRAGVARRGVPPRQAVVRNASRKVNAIPDRIAEDQEALVLIEAIAATLGHPRGPILTLRVCKDLRFEEIATRLGLSRRAVTRHWSVIRRILRRHLGSH